MNRETDNTIECKGRSDVQYDNSNTFTSYYTNDIKDATYIDVLEIIKYIYNK